MDCVGNVIPGYDTICIKIQVITNYSRLFCKIISCRTVYNDKLYDDVGNEPVTYTYYAWGNVTDITDTSGINLGEINPFGYRGYYTDRETGLYYLESRYYDPETARFINADEASYALFVSNIYTYCYNNPVNISDSSGHWGVLIKWKTDTVAWIIDVAVALTGVFSAGMGVKTIIKLIKQNRKMIYTKIKKQLVKYGLGVLTSSLNLAFTILDRFRKLSSVGGIIAYALDYLDGNYNGRISYYIGW